MAATLAIAPSPSAFSMSVATLARFDGTVITLASIQERKHIVWINTDDDNDCLAVVNSCPAMLFTRSDGVDVVGVPR
ncbi:unnamed protein product [Sphagnum troendelagicum]|uniref:Uncharacterized protein n=1 Tax=Sphagnum troendelagicum TaxID=128251 RepID=A0ABP0V1J8_9BRYO